MKTITGWGAILISLFSLAPSLVPGAMSLIGLLISMLALVLAVFSVEKGRKGYFVATLIIVMIGIFVVNDVLSLWGGVSGAPVEFISSIYGISFLVIAACMLWANKLFSREKGA